MRQLPVADQEFAARFLLAFATPDADRQRLTDEQMAQTELAKREVCERKIATDEEMDDVRRRFGL